MTWVIDRGECGMYRTDQLEFREIDRVAVSQRLTVNGPRACEERKRAEEIWAERS